MPEIGRVREEVSQHKEKGKRKREKTSQLFYLLLEHAALDVGKGPGGLAVAMASWRPLVGCWCRWAMQASSSGG